MQSITIYEYELTNPGVFPVSVLGDVINKVDLALVCLRSLPALGHCYLTEYELELFLAVELDRVLEVRE